MTLDINQNTAPGVYVEENANGAFYPNISSFQAIYMVGSAAQGEGNVPVQVTSLTDFTTKFGASPSTSAVRLLFRNNSRAVLYFVRTLISRRAVITVDTVASGVTYDVTIEVEGSTPVTVTTAAMVANSTVQNAATAIAQVINANTTLNQLVFASANDDEVTVRFLTGSTDADLTVTTTSNRLTITAAAPTEPSHIDYTGAIGKFTVNQGQLPQGFLIAPQAFQLLTDASQRQSVGVAMENLVSNSERDWCAIVDFGASVSSSTALQTEANLYASPEGHSAVYAGYLTDLEDAVVPPSPAVAAIATRRIREQGIQNVPAGVGYPIQGVKRVNSDYSSRALQAVLNPAGINVIINKPGNGVCIWGARTRSTSPFYRFVSTRYVMNVLNSSLKNGFDQLLFRSIDGAGKLLLIIEQAAQSICDRLQAQGALYGSATVPGFVVVCNQTNNTAANVEAGVVVMDVYAVPSPTAERILINTIRTTIGNLPSL